MQLCLKNKRIERLDTYISELKKKVRAEQKTKAKYKAQIDRFMGVAPISNNQPQVAINHKEEFENDLRDCLKDSHKRL
jgi:predicted RNase H-like nuclease (RuvC/YqgF family)